MPATTSSSTSSSKSPKSPSQSLQQVAIIKKINSEKIVFCRDEERARSEGLPVHQQGWITLSASGSLIRVGQSLSTVFDPIINIKIIRVFLIIKENF